MTFVSRELIADYGSNEIGLGIGYFAPTDYEAYFPIQPESVREYLRYDNAFVDVFYNRKINKGFDAGFSLGFAGVLDNSDHNTILNSFPMSVYGLKKITDLYGLDFYAGGGLNYWYMKTKENGMRGLSGYHLKVSFRYQFLQAELGYSTINGFGVEEEDVGGWSFKIGAALRFSYY
ncbi:hypothetical protein KKA14_20555 [bacterium]|nr:hypothetical protein [bacterium]